MRVVTTPAGIVTSWLPAPASAATSSDANTPMSAFLVDRRGCGAAGAAAPSAAPPPLSCTSPLQVAASALLQERRPDALTATARSFEYR
eukprot:307712-Chlamydomonas_euryale.AAC.1